MPLSSTRFVSGTVSGEKLLLNFWHINFILNMLLRKESFLSWFDVWNDNCDIGEFSDVF